MAEICLWTNNFDMNLIRGKFPWFRFFFLSALFLHAPLSWAGTLSVTNGSFSNVTGQMVHGGGWYGSVPNNWQTASSLAGYYTVQNIGGTYYANLQTLGPSSPFTPLRQNVGTVDVTSDVTLTFTQNTLSGASTLGSGIYNLALAPYTSHLASYASESISGPSTVTYTARGVGPNTSIYIAFWNGANAAGISGVSITDSATTYQWNGGVGGAWTNGGGGWTDKFDNTAATYNNAKPVVTQFTNASAGTSVTVAADGVTVGKVQVAGANYSFSGGSINMTNSTWSVEANRTATVGSTLAGSTGLTKNDSGTLLLTGANTYTGGTTVSGGTLALHGGSVVGNITNNANLSITGDLVNVVSGTGSLTKTGGGNATLWDPNSYTGATVVEAGTLTLGGAGAISANSALQINSGANINLTGAYAPSNTNRTFAGLTGGGVLYGSGGTVTINKASGSDTFSGDIQSGQGLIKDGAGTLVLNGASSFSGGTTLAAGTLRVGNANALGSGSLTVNGGTLELAENNFTAVNLSGTGGTISLGTNRLTAAMATGREFAGTISGTGGFQKSGTNYLTLKGINTYTGGTEVTAGTLFVTGSGTLGAANGAITLSGSGVLDLRNQQTLTGPITLNSQGAKITSGNGTGSIVNNGGAFQIGGGWLDLALSGTGGMNITGGGQITSSNSYTGATTISGTAGWYGTGTFFLNNANALGAASGDLTISGGIVSLVNNTLTRSGNLTISGGHVHTGTISKSGSNYDIQGGQIDAVLAGTAGLTKSGAGTSHLTSSNTYSGGTTINGGILAVTSAGALGDAAGAVTVNSGATLYTGGGLTVSRTGNVTIDGGNLTTDNGNFGTISVSGGNFIANNAAVLAVRLAGTGGLTVGGTGETYLWTDSSYTGATVVNSGTLTLGGVGAISTSSTLQIASGAAINLTGAYASNNINRTFAGLTGAGVLYGGGGTVTVNKASGTDTFTGDIQGAQGLIKLGAGTLALGGASSYTGATMVNAGILSVAHGSALGSTAGGTVVNSGGQLRLNSTSGGLTVGNEALTISGTGYAGDTGGALRNSAGNNTYQGRITLAGDANIGAANGTSLTLDVASGNAIEANNFNLTLLGAGSHLVNDAIHLGSGGLTKTGTGTATLNGTLGAGSLSVNQGTLALGSAGRLAAGAVANVSGGTLSTGGNETITRLNATGGTVNLTGDVLTVTGTGANKSTVGSSATLTGGSISIQGALDYQATSGSTALSVASGGSLSGSGTTSGTLSVSGILAPGNSTGTLNVGNTTFLAGGKYTWEIDDFSGTVGTSWDFLNITGNLDITAGTGAGNQFLIDVISLLASTDGSGPASNFTDSMNYSFAIATASGTINNYDSGKFLINTAGFQNAFTGTWGTSLSGDGKSLNITYTAATAIPEPSTGVLALCGLVIVALRRRFSVK